MCFYMRSYYLEKKLSKKKHLRPLLCWQQIMFEPSGEL